MFYNERVTTNASHRVGIYEGNQGQALMKQGQQWKSEAEKELAQAKDLEEKGHKLNLAHGMNELANNDALMNNPQELGQEMDKLAQNVASNINDEELKVKVLTDFELSKGSYLNKATTNMKRIQAENARSATYDSVYKSIDSLSTSFGNTVSGNYDENDIVNYQYSLDRIKENINARNIDGTYMFSDAQRRAMAKDADNALVSGFIDTYANLPEAQRKSIRESLEKGDYSFKLSDESSVSAKDVLGDVNYNDIKRAVAKYENALMNEQLKQYNFEKKMAVYEFEKNPTEAGLEKVLQYNPNMSEDKRDKLRKTLEESPMYQNEQKTMYADFEAANNAILEFADMDFETDDEKFESVIDIVNKINKSCNKNKLEIEDADKLKGSLLTAMIDDNVRDNMREMKPYYTSFWDSVFTISPTYDRMKVKKQLEDMALPYQKQVIEGITSGASADEMKIYLQQARRKFINFKYPPLEGKENGDTISLQGVTYKIISLDPVPTLEPVL